MAARSDPLRRDGLSVEAMIFAAGIGTRLRPITDQIPKALVPVAGTPMLERVALRLVEAGAQRIVINVHRFGDRIREFVEERDGFGVEVLFSEESGQPLETGGGLLRAAPLLEWRAPVLLHNVDVISELSLRDQYRAHRDSGGLATVAVNRRDASRYMLFDEYGLCGHVGIDGESRLVRPSMGDRRRLAFCGVHVVAPDFPRYVTETGVFSIIESYLRLAADDHRILPFDVTGALWLDIGSPERLAHAERALAGAAAEG